MDVNAIINKNLIINDEYERDIIFRIIDKIGKDIASIYNAVSRDSGKSLELTINDTKTLKNEISEYVGGIDDSNTGKILLFLSKLPVIANDIASQIEKEKNQNNGINTIVSRDNVDVYIKNLFLCGYEKLYQYQEKRQVATYLYYECEKFIDALVLEFKKDISYMIDPDNMVYDDIYLIRRLIKNRENELDNYTPPACVNCDTNCNHCKHLPEKDSIRSETDSCIELIKIIDKKLQNQPVDDEVKKLYTGNKLHELVKNIISLEPDGKHKDIQFKCDPKIFSVISAERFEKIIKRRYNDVEAYGKDRDIYYILKNCIDSRVFTGDELLSDIDKIYEAYTSLENIKQS